MILVAVLSSGWVRADLGIEGNRFKAILYNLVILFIFLAVFGIGQALRGVKGDGEFKKGDFTLLDNHDSGLAVVSRISEGMVEGGLSVALRLGRSAINISLASGCRMVLMPRARIFRALSCLQVYLSCCREVGQLDRI